MTRHISAFLAILCLLGAPAFAQGTSEPAAQGDAAASPAAPSVSIELNKTEQVDAACRLTFIMQNGLETQVETMGFEVAVINREGLVSGLILMRSGQLPVERERVKQFDVPNVQCESIDRLLLNQVVECQGDAGPVEGCAKAVVASSRAEVAFE